MRSKPKEVFVVAAKRTASFWGTRLVSGFPQKDAVPFEKRSWARLSQKDVVILGSLVLVGRTTSFDASPTANTMFFTIAIVSLIANTVVSAINTAPLIANAVLFTQILHHILLCLQ